MTDVGRALVAAPCDVDPADRYGDPPPLADPVRGPKVAERQPWFETNTDESPNVGAYAVQAAAHCVHAAVELLVAAGRLPTRPAPSFIARMLMDACDRIQAGVRADHRADPMANSHARARGALATAMTYAPFPVDLVDDHGHVASEHAATVHAWFRRVVLEGIDLLDLAVELSGIDWRRAG